MSLFKVCKDGRQVTLAWKVKIVSDSSRPIIVYFRRTDKINLL